MRLKYVWLQKITFLCSIDWYNYFNYYIYFLFSCSLACRFDIEFGLLTSSMYMPVCVCVCLSVYIIRDVYLCSFFINNLQAISVCTKRTRGRGRERRKKREFFFFFLSFPEIMRLVSNIFAMITDRYYHLFSTLSFWSSVVQGQNWQIICSDLLMNRL